MEKQTISTWQSYVRAFHETMDLPRQPFENPTQLNGDLLASRLRLIDEETDELVDAACAYDVIETVDAICDLAYVVLGTFDCVGRIARPRFELLVNTTVIRGWQGFSRPVVNELNQLGKVTSVLLEQMADDFRDGSDFTQWGLLDVTMIHIAHLCSATGIDMRPVFAEVHRSNMAKAGGKVIDGKLRKPDGWSPPDIRGELIKQGWAA